MLTAHKYLKCEKIVRKLYSHKNVYANRCISTVSRFKQVGVLLTTLNVWHSPAYYIRKPYRVTNIAMNTVRHSFLILQMCGLWWPAHWSDSSWKTRLYKCYTTLLAFLIFTATLCELIYLMSTIKDIEAFVNNSFLLLSMLGMCGKATNILMRRNGIIDLTLILNNDICRPEGNEEINIQQKFDDTIRSVRRAFLNPISIFL